MSEVIRISEINQKLFNNVSGSPRIVGYDNALKWSVDVKRYDNQIKLLLSIVPLNDKKEKLSYRSKEKLSYRSFGKINHIVQQFRIGMTLYQAKSMVEKLKKAIKREEESRS